MLIWGGGTWNIRMVHVTPPLFSTIRRVKCGGATRVERIDPGP